MTATDTHARDYAGRAVAEIAVDIIAQIIDGDAPHRDYSAQAADGSFRPQTRVFFAVGPHLHAWIPPAAVRVALDLDPVRVSRPAHEVRVYFERPAPEGIAAAIAAAVLERLDPTADYAR